MTFDYQPATAVGLVFGGMISAAAYLRGESGALAMFALAAVATFLWFMAIPGKARQDTLVNIAMTLLPLFVILVKMPGGSWINTYRGLTVPFMVSAFGIFLMRQFFMSLPVELEEAARVDGLSRFGTYWRIALPLSRPALATLGVLTFQGNWDSFMMQSFIASTDNMFTLPVGLARFSFTYQTYWPQVMAGSMVVILPILIIYIFVQRYSIEGVASTGVKG